MIPAHCTLNYDSMQLTGDFYVQVVLSAGEFYRDYLQMSILE